jgi:glutamine amidotransferase
VCRHLAYVGPPVALSQLLFGAPRALAHAARDPQHQHPPEDNRDGFGVGWYRAGRSEPDRYVSLDPIWEDAAFARQSNGIVTTGAVAAARAASPGAAIEVTGNAPFESGPWLFSLNGRVDGFYDGLGDDLRKGLGAHWHDSFDGDADSEVLFAMVLDRLDAGVAPGDALGAVVADVVSRTTGKFNLLLSDGVRIAATAAGNSLFTHARDGAVTVASEPIDNGPGWQPVRDGSLLEAEAGRVTQTPLEVRG